MTTQTEDVCDTCKGALWVADESWQPEDHERHRPRLPGAGLLPCGTCNAGNWDGPQPYPGWPGPCHDYACDDAPHPCALFHDPMSCDRPPVDGCGCDLEALINPQPATVLDADEEPEPAEDLGPEPEWCQHRDCYDRTHVDGLHTDEDGRLFRGAPDPVDEPRELVYDDDPDTDQVDDEAVQWPTEVITEPPQPLPQPFPLTPIYDQLVTEQRERTR